MRRRLLLLALPPLAWTVAGTAAPMRSGPRFPIPPGYVRVAHDHGVPAALLFGIALQESLRLVSARGQRRPLPWPWTLNIGGTGHYYEQRSTALSALLATLRAGRREVDIGVMQVNWACHQQRLGTPQTALEPYHNLHVGAAILAEAFASTNDWREAVGRYHAPADPARARAYAASVFARLGRWNHD